MATAEDGDIKVEVKKAVMSGEEQQEYITKLQTGKIKLPSEASELEHQILDNLTQAGQRVRQISTHKSDTEKQIDNLQQRVKSMDKDMEAISGEMAGYARLLLSVEEKRRSDQAKDAQKADGQPTDAEPKAEAKGKKPGPPKGVQPAHLKKLNGGKGNGKAEPATEAPSAPATEAQAQPN